MRWLITTTLCDDNGLDYNNLYGIVLRLKGGNIAEIREYMDTELVKNIFG